MVLQQHRQVARRDPAAARDHGGREGRVQKLEHYCIAAWGTSRAIAEALDEPEVVQAMQQAIDEGEQLDQRLTEIAEQEIYPALQGGDVQAEVRSFQAYEEVDESAEEETSSRRGRSKGKVGEART